MTCRLTLFILFQKLYYSKTVQPFWMFIAPHCYRKKVSLDPLSFKTFEVYSIIVDEVSNQLKVRNLTFIQCTLLENNTIWAVEKRRTGVGDINLLIRNKWFQTIIHHRFETYSTKNWTNIKYHINVGWWLI